MSKIVKMESRFPFDGNLTIDGNTYEIDLEDGRSILDDIEDASVHHAEEMLVPSYVILDIQSYLNLCGYFTRANRKSNFEFIDKVWTTAAELEVKAIHINKPFIYVATDNNPEVFCKYFKNNNCEDHSFNVY